MEELKEEIKEVKEQIKKVEGVLTKVEGVLTKVEALPVGDPERARLVALTQEKVALTQEKAALTQEKAALAQRLAALAQAAAHPQPGHVQPDFQNFVLMKFADLEMKVAKASHTTRTFVDIGKDYLQQANTSNAGPPPASVNLAEVAQAVRGKLNVPSMLGQLFHRPHRFDLRSLRSLARVGEGDMDVDEERPAANPPPAASAPTNSVNGLTLADILEARFPGQAIKETNHMQPVLMEVLEGLQSVLDEVLPGGRARLHLKDTHAKCDLRDPTVRPDCTAFAGPMQAWSQVVTHFEFKLSEDDRHEMVGQLVQRSAAVLYAQEKRQKVWAVGITMNMLEVLQFTRQPGHTMSVVTSQLQPFYISHESQGFKLLVDLLAATPGELGFSLDPPVLPLEALGEFHLQKAVLLRQGSASRSCSHVFAVTASTSDGQEETQMVLKLNSSDREARILEKLAGLPNIIQLVASQHCIYRGETWHALLLKPYVEHLSATSALPLMAQVVCDIARAVGAAFHRGVLHRDVTPNNIGHLGGRGYLLDFSAGKVVEPGSCMGSSGSSAGSNGLPNILRFTGTLLWAPYSVLCGQQHTVSSQLDGLFISIAYISMGGLRWPGRYEGPGNNIDDWQALRLQQFSGKQMWGRMHIAEQLRPLVEGLHELFWVQGGYLNRSYCTGVSVEDVVRVCLAVAPGACT